MWDTCDDFYSQKEKITKNNKVLKNCTRFYIVYNIYNNTSLQLSTTFKFKAILKSGACVLSMYIDNQLFDSNSRFVFYFRIFHSFILRTACLFNSTADFRQTKVSETFVANEKNMLRKKKLNTLENESATVDNNILILFDKAFWPYINLWPAFLSYLD